MAERPAPADDQASEALATTGLFLNFAAVIAIAVSLASWSSSEAIPAAVASIAAVLTFPASIVCFRLQADDRVRQPAV
jgi:hypothetical protein